MKKIFKHLPTDNMYHTNGASGLVRIDNSDSAIPMWLVENSKDWQEIIEKDYEILSIWRKTKKYENLHFLSECKNQKGKPLYRLDGTNMGSLSSEKELIKAGYTIHSVKRLSDGEVFTVGDKCKLSNWKEYCTIKYFTIIADILYFGIEDSFKLSEYPNWYNFIKPKKPLFTTEDGVDIFEGNKYWKNNGWLNVKLNIAGKDEPYILNDKPFSTKKLAKEYIIMNKPCLSIKDIQDYFTIATTPLPSLIKLVKSRL